MDYTSHLIRAAKLSMLLDTRFRLGKFSFGLDPLFGLIPGGDFAPLAVSIYMIWIGHKIGLSQTQLFRMYVNTLLDFLIGNIPIIGDIGDFFYRSHTKNLTILKEPPSTIPTTL